MRSQDIMTARGVTYTPGLAGAERAADVWLEAREIERALLRQLEPDWSSIQEHLEDALALLPSPTRADHSPLLRSLRRSP